MTSYVDDLTTRFQAQFKASSYSVESAGAHMSIGTITEKTIADGNKVDAPVFGIKPDQEVPYNIKSGTREGEGMELFIDKLSSAKLGIVNYNMDSYASAEENITTIQKAIELVSLQRSKLGAYQNRMETANKVVENQGENLQAAESRIRDTDMAKEMTEFSKYKMLEQASQSMS